MPPGIATQKDDPNTNIPDDTDVFLVDNVAVMFPSAIPDFEAQVVKII